MYKEEPKINPSIEIIRDIPLEILEMDIECFGAKKKRVIDIEVMC
jgi:hypothetical protein